MSHNFNSNRGRFGSSPNHVPHSLEFFDGSKGYGEASPSLQAPFAQQWSGTPSWPVFENAAHNYGIPPQNKELDSTSYFSNQQQDYTALDESDDFYENEEQTGIGRGSDAQTSGHHQIPTTQLQSAKKHVASRNSAEVSLSEARERLGEESPTSNRNIQKPSERLAQLRATLLSQQRNSATPTPSKVINDTNKPEKVTSDGKSHQITSGGTVRTQAEAGAASKASKITVKERADDKSLNTSENPTFSPSTSHADVEALIHSVKASIPATSASKPRTAVEQRIIPSGGTAHRKATSKAKGESTAPVNHLQQDSINAGSPSEASELGEIREESPEPGPVRQLPEPQSTEVKPPDVLGTDRRASSSSNTNQPARDIPSNPRNQSEKVTVPISDSKQLNLSRPGNTDARTSQRESALKPSRIHDEHAWSQRPNKSHDAIRDSRSQPAQEPRPQLDRDLDPRHLRSQDYEQSSQYGTNAHDRHWAAKDEHPLQLIGNRKVKAVAQDAATSEPSSNAMYNRVSQRNGERTTNDVEPSLATMKKPSLTQTDFQGTPTTKDTERIDVINKEHGTSAVREWESIDRIEPSLFASQQVYEDVVDWLELTGWSDEAYRNQALMRHRRMKALDAQRAELEREAQLEMEQRSRSLRARSALPVESSVSQYVFSSNVVPVTSGRGAMGPPPLPAKERDEIGIQIKNSANSEGQAIAGRVETDQSSKPSVNSQFAANATSKRSRADSFGLKREMPSEKLPRLNMGDRSDSKKTLASPTIKDESLETRITRNHEPSSATKRRSSRSPGRRYRSASPANRRASDTGGYDSRSRFGEASKGNRYSPYVSRNPSPSRRDSDHRHQNRDNYRVDSDTEPRAEFERDHGYQSYVPNGYRGRGNRRGFGYNGYRNKTYNIRGGAQGRSHGSDSLNLKDGGQSLG